MTQKIKADKIFRFRLTNTHHAQHIVTSKMKQINKQTEKDKKKKNTEKNFPFTYLFYVACFYRPQIVCAVCKENTIFLVWLNDEMVDSDCWQLMNMMKMNTDIFYIRDIWSIFNKNFLLSFSFQTKHTFIRFYLLTYEDEVKCNQTTQIHWSKAFI